MLSCGHFRFKRFTQKCLKQFQEKRVADFAKSVLGNHIFHEISKYDFTICTEPASLLVSSSILPNEKSRNRLFRS